LHANNIVCENIIHSRQSRGHTYKAIYHDDSAETNKNRQKNKKTPNVHNPKQKDKQNMNRFKLRSLPEAMIESKNSNRQKGKKDKKQSHQHHS
jgi:hypothetical protein